MSRRGLKWSLIAAAAVLLAGASVWLREETYRVYSHQTPGPRAPIPHGPGHSTDAAPAIAWVELQKPALAPSSENDGDSFLIRHGGGTEHILRLYFVDCPEKRRHQFNRARLADQGAYFGGLAESDTVRLGREARQFALDLLAKQPFQVFTRWEPVYESRRHYAHIRITLPDGQERWLAELLVEAGLARIHTKGTDLPGGARRGAFEYHLRRLESAARLAGRGGWKELRHRDAEKE